MALRYDKVTYQAVVSLIMNPYLKNTLEMGPVVVSRLLDRVSPDVLDQSRPDGRFTVREVVAHMADWEPILRKRIIDVRDQDGFTVKIFDEGQMAIDNCYTTQSVEEALSAWKLERAETAAIVRALGDSDLSRPYFHPERGREFLGDLVNSIIGHDMYHIEQISEYL